MNRITIVGNLTAKPELRYTKSNTATCNFTVAVPRIKDGTDFINCIVWGKQAENLCNYMDKGNKIAIDGRLETSTYEKQDGTKGYKTEVVAQTIEFIGGKKMQESAVAKKKDQVDIYAEFGDIVSTDANYLD